MIHKIGIITPSFNQGEFIEATIKSVISQSRRVDYYAIYDSCSSDGTHDIIKKYSNDPRISRIVVKKDKGQADAINNGFNDLPSDINIMGYLNSDDVLAPGAIENIIKLFEANPHIDLITGWRKIIGVRGREGILCKTFPREKEDMFVDVGFKQEATFWRRSLYERAGGYVDSTYKFALDSELWVRMSEAKWNPYYYQGVLGKFRVHPQAKSSTLFLDHGLPEINRIRINRNIPPISASQFKRRLYQIRLKEEGLFHLTYWRIFNHLQNRILLPYFL